MTFRTAPGRAGLLGLQLVLDGSARPPVWGSNVTLGSSGGNWEIYPTSPPYRVPPGPHRLEMRILLTSGIHEITARAFDLTIYDRDSLEPLTTLRFPEQRAMLQNEQAFTWTFDVPAFTQ